MVQVGNVNAINYSNANSVYNQVPIVSPPVFAGTGLAQPSQDGFVSTQPKEEESFYQKHKALVWGAGLVAAAGLAWFTHGAFKTNKLVEKNAKKITDAVEKLNVGKVQEDVNALRNSHPDDVFTLYDLRNPNNKKFLEGLAEYDLGHSKDATHAIVSYAKSDKPDKSVKKLLKLYKPGEVDSSITELVKEKGYAVID